MLNEVLLIKRLRVKDNAAFQELIDEFGPRLFKAAKSLTTNEQEAEELITDTFANAFIGIKKFKQESSLYSWLYRILFNRFYYLSRQRKKEITLGISFQDIAQAIAGPNRETTNLFRQYLPGLISRLSRDQQEAVLLRYLESMEIKDIAKFLRITEGAVNIRLHRARNNLRKIIKQGKFNQLGVSK